MHDDLVFGLGLAAILVAFGLAAALVIAAGAYADHLQQKRKGQDDD